MKKKSPYHSLSIVVILPDASLYGFSGSTADCIQAVCEFVLFVIQEPSRISQAPDLHPCISLGLQLLCNLVHIQQDTCPTGTGDTNSELTVSSRLW